MAKILVIEDEPDLRDDLADVLRSDGHETIEAADGRQGLQIILSESPDLVISDINMPVMDGHELLETLHTKHAEYGTIPFIFLTAFADREHVILGKRLGADDYLTKPVDHELLLETVKTRLRQTQRFDDRMKAELETLQKAVLTSLPHELRTPLNGILGFAELLQMEADDGKLSAEAVEYTASILHSGRRLKTLVDNVLDLVAITAGRLVPRPEPIDLNQLLQACAKAFKGEAEKAGVYLMLAGLSPDLPEVQSDPKLLRRALNELIGNAVKFTESGGHVVISAALDGAEFVKIRVTDTGRGIDEQTLPKLGTPFSKPGAGALATADDGPGLGLSMAHAFVTLVGAELSISSKIRVGTTAEITLARPRS